MKVVMTSVSGPYASDEGFVSELQTAFPDVAFHYAGSQDEQRRLIGDADVFFGWPERDVFLAAERLQWIQCPGTGVDELAKVPELIESDIVLTNSRGPHAPPMADHVMGMIVNLAHLWRQMFEDQQRHVWESRKYHQAMLTLAGSTIGILALGDIGSQVAQRAHGFDMEVYAVDVDPRTPPPSVKEVWGPDRLDDLLRISDWFVVTAPLTADTRGLVDRRRLGLMKETAHVIIISRGGIVDEDALTDALASGRLAGAGIDAFLEEPLAPESPLWDMANVVITPHNSAATADTIQGRREIFGENLRRFLANEPFLYTVDKRAGF